MRLILLVPEGATLSIGADGSQSYDAEVVAVVEPDGYAELPDVFLEAIEEEVDGDPALKADVGSKSKNLTRTNRLIHLFKGAAKHAQKGGSFREKHKYATVAAGEVIDFGKLIRDGGLVK